VYRDLKNLDAALADYSTALSLDPQDWYTYSNRGVVEVDRGQLAAAIDDFSKAIEIKPDYAEAWFNRGVAKRRAGDETGGAADKAHAAKLDSRFSK